MTITKTTDRASKILDGARNICCYSLENHFSGEPLTDKPTIWGECKPGDTHRPLIEVSQVGFLRHELKTKSTKLIDSGNNHYTVRVHSNLWFTFESGPAAPKTTIVQSDPSTRFRTANAPDARYGDVCPACWCALQPFVREDCRPEEEQRDNPVSDEQRTILSCPCLPAGDLCYYGNERTTHTSAAWVTTDNCTELEENIAAISAEIHTSPLWDDFYKKHCDALSGFPGFWRYAIDAAKAFTAAEKINRGLFEWVDAIMFFSASVVSAEHLPAQPELKTLAEKAIENAKH